MSDDEGVTPDLSDEAKAKLEVAREQVDAAVRGYIQILRSESFADDPPYVQAWVVGVEWTNVAAERENWGGRDTISPFGQMLSIGLGLGEMISHRFR